MKTYLSSIFPEVVDVDTSELKLCYVTKEHLISKNITLSGVSNYIPTFWAFYKGELLYCLVDYQLHFLEDFTDWHSDFNHLFPGDFELSLLLKYNIKYFHVLPEVFKEEEVRDHISQWEDDLIKTWNRDKKINDLLK
jgi:hypothetical protein